MSDGIPGIYVSVRGDTDQLKRDMDRARGLVRTAAKGISDDLGSALSAQQVTRGVNQLVGNLNKVKNALRIKSPEAFKMVGVDLKNVAALTGVSEKKFAALQARMMETSAQRSMTSALKRLGRQMGMTQAETKALGRSLGLTQAQMRGFESSSRRGYRSVNNLGTGIRRVNGLAAALGVTLSAVGMAQFVKETQSARREMISVERAFKTIRGGAAGAADEVAWLRGVTAELGKNFYQIAPSFKGLLAAGKEVGWTIGELRGLFEGLIKASTALGLGGQRVSGILVAMQQMISKGVISMEEARRQLGEHLPGAMNILAEAAGMTLQQFYAMVEAGKVSSDVLKNLGGLLESKFGADAQRYAQDSIATWERFGEASKDLSVTIGDELSPQFDRAVKGMTAWMNANGDSVAGMIGGTVKALVAVGENLNAVGAAAGAGAAAFGIYKLATTDLRAAFGGLRVAFRKLMIVKFLTSPATLAVGAVAALAGGMVLLNNYTNRWHERLMETAGAAETNVKAWRAAEDQLTGLKAALGEYDQGMAKANDDAAQEAEMVDKLAKKYPALAGEYKTTAQAIANINKERLHLGFAQVMGAQ